MSFTGNLEHLSIVDIMQLLHATRKSGVLRVQGRKGESRLVFKDGYIVSASHLNVRIGQILQDLGMISAKDLDQALQEQKAAGDERKPFIVTLLEKELIREEDAYKGLQALIEMTVVEMLTWKTGSFGLDIEDTSVSDDYQYYPDKISKEINVDTQRALMDALRIYDEKKRDGELEDDFEVDEEIGPRSDPEKAGNESAAPEKNGPWASDGSLSAEDLGLSDLDSLEARIPGVFTTIKDIDPSLRHREKIEEFASHLSGKEKESLLSFLNKLPFCDSNLAYWKDEDAPDPAILLLSTDPLLRHAVSTVCSAEGFSILAGSDENEIYPILDRASARGNPPLLILDDPEPGAHGNPELPENPPQNFPESHPLPRAVQLISPEGIRWAIASMDEPMGFYFPRPRKESSEGAFAEHFILFLKSLPDFLNNFSGGVDAGDVLHEDISDLSKLKSDPDTAFALLRFVSKKFGRTIAFVVRKGQLVAEKSIGVEGSGSKSVVGFTVPLTEGSLLRPVIEKGNPLYDRVGNGVFDTLFGKIGPPRDRDILLLPVRVNGKTVSLIYGDTAQGTVSSELMEILEIFSTQAGLMLENAFYRRKIGKSSK